MGPDKSKPGTVWLPAETVRALIVSDGQVQVTTWADVSGEYGPGLAHWEGQVSVDLAGESWPDADSQPDGPNGVLIEVVARPRRRVEALTADGFILDLDRTDNPVEVLDTMGGSEEAQYVQLLVDRELMSGTRRLVVVSRVAGRPAWQAATGLTEVCLNAVLARVADREGDLVACAADALPDGEEQQDADGRALPELLDLPDSLLTRMGFTPVTGGLWVRTDG